MRVLLAILLSAASASAALADPGNPLVGMHLRADPRVQTLAAQLRTRLGLHTVEDARRGEPAATFQAEATSIAAARAKLEAAGDLEAVQAAIQLSAENEAAQRVAASSPTTRSQMRSGLQEELK